MKNTIRYNGNSYDLKTLTDEELSDVSRELLEINARIAAQIDSAKLKKITDGEYSDPVWFNKARGSKRAYGIKIQAVNAERSRRKRENREQGSINLFYRLFFDGCIELMSSEAADMMVRGAVGLLDKQHLGSVISHLEEKGINVDCSGGVNSNPSLVGELPY